MARKLPAKLTPESQDIDAYLSPSKIIDFEHGSIQAISQTILRTTQNETERARIAYEFVRDRVPHSFDIQGQVVTCKASDVLQHQEGICFAKAHLLAALLRSIGIPAGFCYQRLVFDDAQPGYQTLHGLNAIYLQNLQRWIRLDARGNKPGIQAEFNLEQEQLAFPVRPELQEVNYSTVYARPNAGVVEALRSHTALTQLASHLPSHL